MLLELLIRLVSTFILEIVNISALLDEFSVIFYCLSIALGLID